MSQDENEEENIYEINIGVRVINIQYGKSWRPGRNGQKNEARSLGTLFALVVTSDPVFCLDLNHTT